jgi:hypothetical protein
VVDVRDRAGHVDEAQKPKEKDEGKFSDNIHCKLTKKEV